MVISSYVMEEEEEVEVATELVTREIRRKKAVDATALEKTLKIEVPADVLLKESIVDATHKVIEMTENLQQLVVTGVCLNDVKESKKEKATWSEAATSEAPRGNADSHNISNIIDIGSSTTSASLSTFVTTSSDMDDIPLDRVYANLQKSLSPSYQTQEKA